MARRKPISILRGKANLQRRFGRRPPRSVTLIVCEGHTEREYFEAARIHYKLTTAEVIVAENTVGPAPISVVECATERAMERGGYDTVFCVFDRNGHESFQRARDTIGTLAARKRHPLQIREAISIPCFELWVLLHFVQTDAPFGGCAEVIDRIRSGPMPSYQKADAETARQLMASLNAALSNADWLERRGGVNDYNPYTTVHRVLHHFASVAGL